VLLFTELCATSYEEKQKAERERKEAEKKAAEKKEKGAGEMENKGKNSNAMEVDGCDDKKATTGDSDKKTASDAKTADAKLKSDPEKDDSTEKGHTEEDEIGPGFFKHPTVPKLHPVTANLSCPHFYLAQYLLELVITSTEMWVLQALPSRLAASCLYLANRIRGIKVPWPKRLEILTKQNEIQHVKPLAKEIFAVVTQIHQAQGLAAQQAAEKEKEEEEKEEEEEEEGEEKKEKDEEDGGNKDGGDKKGEKDVKDGKGESKKEKDKKKKEEDKKKDNKPKGDENSARGVKALFKKYNMRKYYEVAKSVPSH
jgi:hypothetical protein